MCTWSQIGVARGAGFLHMHTIEILVSIEKLGYSFGFVGNMLYMMQQVAPGKYKMTHYAFCTALMNLVLVPTQMASGPLGELARVQAHFFIFVVIASAPSILAAWIAPFPNAEGEKSKARGATLETARRISSGCGELTLGSSSRPHRGAAWRQGASTAFSAMTVWYQSALSLGMRACVGVVDHTMPNRWLVAAIPARSCPAETTTK